MILEDLPDADAFAAVVEVGLLRAVEPGLVRRSSWRSVEEPCAARVLEAVVQDPPEHPGTVSVALIVPEDAAWRIERLWRAEMRWRRAQRRGKRDDRPPPGPVALAEDWATRAWRGEIHREHVRRAEDHALRRLGLDDAALDAALPSPAELLRRLDLDARGDDQQLHLTPEEWHALLHAHLRARLAEIVDGPPEPPQRSVTVAFERLLAELDQDPDDSWSWHTDHVVIWEGRLRFSERAELPPVSQGWWLPDVQT